jgi:hypothetical protein
MNFNPQSPGWTRRKFRKFSVVAHAIKRNETKARWGVICTAESHCWRNRKLRYGTLRLFNKKQCFIVPAQTQQTRVQRLNLENKGVSPYISLQASHRNKKATYGCMWLHWLFHFLSAMWPSSCFNSLSFIFLLCHPFLLPHYQNTACLFLFWSPSLLHHSPLWCSDPPRVKEHHLDLWVCISIASLHVWLFSFYSGLHNGPDRLQYQGNQAG